MAASQLSDVLRSKLIRPPGSDKLVERTVASAFAEQLANGVKVGLVVAPAGYGKSSLLSQSFEALIDRGIRCAWLSLDDNDNDPLRLVSHFLAALNTLGSSDFRLETEQFGADSKSVIDHIVADTVTKLDTLSDRHVLFLDDYHTITNLEVHNLIERLVLYSPPETVFVIAGRNEPELAFQTLRVQEKVCQLSVKDLAFALEESEQFLNVQKKLGLTAELVSALAERTEGWVAGLQLASLALEGRSDSREFVGDFSGTDRDVTDYLGEAVLNRQPAEMRRFLLQTSLLERMNAPLANEVLGIKTAQETLEQAEAQNLFLIPLDRKRNWYRFHHLFGDFLKVQLGKEFPGAAEDIYQRAFGWCVKENYHHEAIHYALCAGMKEQALDLIADIAKDLVQVSGEHWTLLRWLQRLPDEYVLRRPEIGAAVSWSLLFSRELSRARELLGMLDEYCEQQANQLPPELLRQCRRDVGLNRCFLEAAEDNTVHASQLLKEWLANNPDAEKRDMVTAYILQLYSSVSTFETDLGIDAAGSAVAIGEQFTAGFLAAWAQAAAGMSAMQQANLAAAARHFRKGLEYNSRNASPFSYVGCLNTVLLAEVCYELNDTAQAEALLAEHFEYIDNQSVVDIAYTGYRVMAKLQFAHGNLEAGLKLIRLGKESAARAELPRLSAMLSALEIRSLLLAGKDTEAQQLANESGFKEPEGALPLQRASPVVRELHKEIQAELYLSKKLPKHAIPLLDSLVASAKETARQRRLVDVLLLRARAYHASHKPDEALADLERAIVIAAGGGLCRVFIDAGEEVRQLLAIITKQRSGKQSEFPIAFLGEINVLLLDKIKNSNLDNDDEASSTGLIEKLTKRERQILDTIVTGETNKEIAEKLFISDQTVKWHLHQLYQKLGVKNRTSAIAKAQALSLV